MKLLFGFLKKLDDSVKLYSNEQLTFTFEILLSESAEYDP